MICMLFALRRHDRIHLNFSRSIQLTSRILPRVVSLMFSFLSAALALALPLPFIHSFIHSHIRLSVVRPTITFDMMLEVYNQRHHVASRWRRRQI